MIHFNAERALQKITLVLPVLPHYRIDLLSSLADALAEKGQELTVITGTNAGKKDVKESHGVSFKLIKNRTVGVTIKRFEIQWQSGLIRNIFKTKPDKVVILYHAGKINMNIMLLLLQLRGIPYVLWGSGSGDRRTDLSAMQRRLKAIFKYLFVKNSSAYLCYGTRFAQQLRDQGYPSDKIFVAQNTLNVEAIYAAGHHDLSSRKFELTRFLFVGVIFSKKRLDAAIDVCKRLKEAGAKFQFDIVGGGEYLETLKERASGLDVTDVVHFHGPQYGDDLKGFFERANVFLLPGTGGLAVNEAMAYSLPVITTPGDSTAYDLIDDGQNGFILDFDYDLDQLESKMKFFIEASQEEKEKMGQKSLSIIKERAPMHNMVTQIIKSLGK